MSTIRKNLVFEQKVIDNINTYNNVIGNDNFNTKVSEICVLFPSMIKYARIELANMFSTQEIKGIIHSMTGKTYTQSINPILFLKAQIDEAVLLEKIEKLYFFDIDELRVKLEKLTSFQVFVIIYLVNEFWSKKISLDNDSEINELFLI